MHTSQAELAEQFELRRKIYDALVADYTAVNELRELRKQLKALEARLRGDQTRAEVHSAVVALEKKLDAAEAGLINPKLQGTQDTLHFGNGIDGKYALLAAGVDSADTAPTASEYELYAELEKTMSAGIAQWRELLAKDVPAFNAMAQRAGVALVAPTPVKEEDEDGHPQ